MFLKNLPLEARLLLYQAHLQGNEVVTQILENQGVILDTRTLTEFVDESAVFIRDTPYLPEYTDKNNDGEKEGEQLPRKEPTDFSFFTVQNRAKRNEKDTDEALSGPSYSSVGERPKSGLATPKKAHIEPLAPVIRKLLKHIRFYVPGQQLDIPPILKKVANHEGIIAFPVKQELNDPHEVYLYLDIGFSNEGLAGDYLALVKGIKHHLNNSTVRVVLLPRGPTGEWGWADNFSYCADPIATPKHTAAACLILTNVTSNSHFQWRHLLRKLRKLAIEPVWLSLKPQTLKHQILKHQAPEIAWKLPGKVLLWGQQSNPNSIESPLTLLTALLLSVRIVNGTLLRQLVRAMQVPSWLELAFWEQDFIKQSVGMDKGEIHLQAEQKIPYIERLKSVPDAELQNYANIIERFVATKSNSMLHEHRLHLALLTGNRIHSPQVLQASIQYLQSLGMNMRQEGRDAQGNALFLQATIEQFDGYIDKADSKIQQTLAIANAYCYQNGMTNEVNPVLAERVQHYLGKEQVVRRALNIYQKGETIVSYFADDILQSSELQIIVDNLPLLATTEHVEGSPLLLNEVENAPAIIKNQEPVALSEVTDFVLQSQFEALSITKRSSKDFYWAKRLSVTSEGVVAETDFLQVIWRNNNSFDWHDYFFKDVNEEVNIVLYEDVPKWLVENRPQLDQYGLFVELSVENQTNKASDRKPISFKLRYIPPGHFLMGSPEDEPQRSSDETQHQIELSEGFWLGETTVTQALWRAVMGENPSHFKPQNLKEEQLLPVEKVSSDDGMDFCRKLNQKLSQKLNQKSSQTLSQPEPDFVVTLPTEAQWEYACRAGTQTPFNTGEQLTTEQANYNGNYPYEGRDYLSKQAQSQQQYREKTLDVNAFAPNAWGLKQMHGNVWEWCLYGRGGSDYAEGIAVGLLGDTKSKPGYALRGGCWVTYAHYCRSAYRYDSPRGYRNFSYGLRLGVQNRSYSATQEGLPGMGRPPVRSANSQKGRSGDEG